MARIFKPTKKKVVAPKQLEVDRLSHDGRGIARHEGKTVFVRGGLPGETVSVKAFNDHRRYAECQAGAIIASASERISPSCEYYARCGGCNLQHLQPEAQLSFKQQSVVEQIQREAGLTADSIASPLVSDPLHYRSRARLGVNRQGELAFRERDSQAFVAVSHCQVLAKPLQPVLTALQALPRFAKACGVGHIELMFTQAATACVIRHTKPMTTKALSWLAEIEVECATSIWLQGERQGPLVTLNGESVDPRLYYSLPNVDIRLAFHPADFTQVNADINTRMVDQALEWLALQGTETVLDLFCGIGNFTLPLARQAAQVIGVEAVESMVARGKENAQGNGVENCSFVAADLESVDCEEAWNRQAIDVVLLDPPRAGAQQVTGLMGRLAANKVLYVSCNPASLARDAQALATQGFRLARLGVMDMFPHTAHIESMALFVRD